jgi:uncharacterized phiE125 gp8 family phage protein
MRLTLVTAPTQDPIDVTAAMWHLHADTDEGIRDLINAATVHAERFLGRALITQTWDLMLDGFPCGEILVPKAPLQSVTSIQYVDTNGATQTLSASDYQVSIDQNGPGRIRPAYGKTWPSARCQMDAVTIRFVAGYGANYAKVPYSIRQGMLLLIADWYENRLPAGSNTATFEALLSPYRVHAYA